MACELGKAAELLLSTPATKTLITNIINNGKTAEKAFGKLVKDTTGKSVDKASFTEFSNGLGNTIRDVTGVTVEEDKNYALKQIRAGLSTYVTGEFDPTTNKITTGSSVTQEEVIGVIAKEFYDKAVEEHGVDVAISQALDGSTAVKAAPEATEVFNTIQDARGTDFLLHELIHAGTVEYMANNPNTREVTRIETIFDYLYNNYKDLGIADGYWRTSTDEFIAEALSNPEFIQELMRVTPTKPVGKLTSMYDVVVMSLLKMLGFKGKELDNLFDILLDSTLKMLENKALKSPVVGKEAGGVEGVTSSEPVSIAEEVTHVANNTESGYTTGTKEAVLLYIQSHPAVARRLKKQGIDLKDC